MTAGPTVPDSHRDLLDAPTAILATNGLDGRPQVTAVSFLHDTDDDLVKFSLNDTRQKTKNLHRDPNATVFILDPANRLRSLEIRGTVELIEDPDFAYAKVTGEKYAPGLDFHMHDQPGETRSIVIMHPTRIVASDLS